MSKIDLLAEKYNKEIKRILGTDSFKLFHVVTKCSYMEKLYTGAYKLVLGDFEQEVARFNLVPMPGCCGICISTGSKVDDEFKGKGIGTLLNSLRIDIAREMGYGLLMCTDVETNTPQRRILGKNGWRDIHKFVNPRTKNSVYVTVVNL